MRISLGATLPQLVQAIQTQEGYYPGSLAYRNNNPGNLIYVGQPGATQGAGGFAAFPTYPAGEAAEESQIQLILARGTCATGAPVVTMADLFNCLTPASSNNTAAYTAVIAASTGIDPDSPLAGQLGTPVFSSVTPVSTPYSAVVDDSAAVDVADASTLDITDPTTLAFIGLGGALLWMLFRR